jgi:hypothetical protein
MLRMLFCLPVCLALAPNPLPPAGLEWVGAALAGVADDGAKLPDDARMEKLAKTDPIAFLENCIKRYDREVKGYEATLIKQERLGGKLQPREVIGVQFREEPFSVLLTWKEGTRLARRTLYVKGKYNDQLVVKPAGIASLIGTVERDPNGADAKSSGRYPLTEFGIKIGMQRTLSAWKNAAKEGALHVEYLGERKIKETGDRGCWVLKRTGYKKPEEDGITEYTTYIDKETWLQVGSVLKGASNELIGEYIFRDIKLNPTFKEGTFTREAVAK